jgi:hypothetical protein
MKMKKWLYLIVAVVFVAGGIISIAIAQSDSIIIDNQYPKKLKNPVPLNHKAHADAIACTECHHTWKKEERETPQKCAECHKADDKSDKGLKQAYHKQCMDCHKDLKKQEKPTGPTTKCTGCHPSKAKSVQ